MQEGWDVWGQWEAAAKIGCHNNSKATHSKANDAEDRLPTCLIIYTRAYVYTQEVLYVCMFWKWKPPGGRREGGMMGLSDAWAPKT